MKGGRNKMINHYTIKKIDFETETIRRRDYDHVKQREESFENRIYSVSKNKTGEENK